MVIEKRAPSSRQKVIVAMPAFNEEKYIGSMVLQVRQYADEVIVVDDGSTDRTSIIAKLAHATVIQHRENKGCGAAIQTILAEARRRKPDILVLLDADTQHDPEQIPALIQAVSKGFDLVIGARRIERRNIPIYRRLGLWILSHFTNVLSRETVFDTESGFRAFSPKAISEFRLKQSGFEIHAEMIAEAAAIGLKIVEVPITAIFFKGGSTTNPIKHGSMVLQKILMMISEKRPLLFFGSCGSLLLVLGFAAGFIVVRTFYTSYVLATGTAFISLLLVTVAQVIRE